MTRFRGKKKTKSKKIKENKEDKDDEKKIYKITTTALVKKKTI